VLIDNIDNNQRIDGLLCRLLKNLLPPPCGEQGATDLMSG